MRRAIALSMGALLGAAPPAAAAEGGAAAKGGPRGMRIEAPRGSAPALDGTLGEGEWADAVSYGLAGGGVLFLKQDGAFLYVGIRAAERGIGSLCVGRERAVSILHASAALGTAVYEAEGDAWKLKEKFSWSCRDTGQSEGARAERLRHLASAGWVASTIRMGRPEEMEYQIDLRLAGPDGLPLAVVFLKLPDGQDAGQPLWWPAVLSDDCRNVELMKGSAPDTLRFAHERWARVAPAASRP